VGQLPKFSYTADPTQLRAQLESGTVITPNSWRRTACPSSMPDACTPHQVTGSRLFSPRQEAGEELRVWQDAPGGDHPPGQPAGGAGGAAAPARAPLQDTAAHPPHRCTSASHSVSAPSVSQSLSALISLGPGLQGCDVMGPAFIPLLEGLLQSPPPVDVPGPAPPVVALCRIASVEVRTRAWTWRCCTSWPSWWRAPNPAASGSLW
jgi:hypothetical protein